MTKIDQKSKTKNSKIDQKSKGLTPLLLVFGMMINSVTASDSRHFFSSAIEAMESETVRGIKIGYHVKTRYNCGKYIYICVQVYDKLHV